YLAGDWVRTGINAGCVEAAVQAGLMASRAISGRPAEIVGECDRFDRPAHQEPVRSNPLAAGPAPSQPAAALPGYVERGGDQSFPQPLRLDGTRFYNFLLEVNGDRLQEACDKYLNGPAGGHVEYRVLVPRVLLGF